MKQLAAKIFLYTAFVILIVTMYSFLVSDSEKNVHIILTGMNRARIFPYIEKFTPYSGKNMGGASAAASVIKGLKSSFNGEDHVVLSVGTELSGTADAFFTKGEAVISILNNLGVNAMLLSNIDYTYGWKRLQELSQKAAFPFISTNTVKSTDNSVPPWLKSGALIKTSSGKFNLGIVGITPESTPNIVEKENIVGLEFPKPETRLKSAIQKLREQGASFVVLLTQYTQDFITQEQWSVISSAKPDICIMLDQELEPPQPYERDGVTVYTISSYNMTKEIDVLDLKIGLSPLKIRKFSSRRIPVNLADVKPDPDMEAIVEKATAEFRSMKNEVLGSFDADYSKSYMSECFIGDMITDAVKESTGAQIVLQNSGGIQESIGSGTFTIGNLFSVLPFDNKIMLIELKGKDVLEALKQAASKRRGVLQTSGLKYTINHKSSSEYALISASLSDGTPIEPEKTYLTAVNNFLYEGGDNFTSISNGKLVSEGISMRTILAEYIKRSSANGAIHLSLSDRILEVE